MEAQLSSAATFGAQQYSDSFFYSPPTDSRYLQTSFIKVPPTTSVESKTIEFTLNRFQASLVKYFAIVSYS